MNIYTGLIISATALMCYYALLKEFTAPVMFIGEFLSINLCWIPSTILYNYLTYFFFNLAAILIYYAIRKERPYLYYFAGVALGLNVFVRIPNLAQMGLIIAVWVGAGISVKGRSAEDKKTYGVLRSTGSCIAGYLIGLGVPVVMLDITRGQYVFGELFSGLSDMSGSNEEYTALSMLIRTALAYIHSAKWMLIILAVVFGGTLMIAALKSNRILKWIGRIIYLGVLLIMFRFFWGRGMYSFRYYEDYTAVYEWAMIILFLAWICIAVVFIKPGYNVLVKTYAAVTLAVLFITPLGSNNYTMQNINNMFLVMPFVLYTIGGWLYRGAHRIRLENVLYGCNFPWMSMIVAVFAFFLIQTTAFHAGFVFCDGMDGTPRDSVIEKNGATESVACMYTTEKNSQTLTDVCEYIHNDGSVSSILYWGDCPGLSYILRIPPAISTSWPDLDSYPVKNFEYELSAMSSGTDNGDMNGVAIVWKKYTDYSAGNVEKKEDILRGFIGSNNMKPVHENEEYIIYR